ncbi:MAG: YifB family Mg chelatase-like AAA ATPase [Bacteroidales bacterium]
MVFRSYCAALNGIEAITVTVETELSRGISFYLVGLPDSAVRESQQRISAALRVVNSKIPGKRITINLAPANIKKEGSSFDLSIAVGILAATGQYHFPNLESYMIMGELALDGSLRPVPGALSIAIHAANSSFKKAIFPLKSAYKACEAEGIEVYGLTTLQEVISLLSGEKRIEPLKRDVEAESKREAEYQLSFDHIKGQAYAKRALEVAAAGSHNLLFIGSPGSGKSMMAQALPSILPPLEREEAIESTMIHSLVQREESSTGLIYQRAFRAPHYSCSPISIMGGGSKANPGEISLAHNGVLYFDELPEFSPRVLEMLRQPMEDRKISISRAHYKVTYPASFMFVASMNPCPCGYRSLSNGRCHCTPYSISRYLSKISGPLIDRIDIIIEVLPVEKELLTGDIKGESSKEIAKRVAQARDVQRKRFGRGGCNTNSVMGPKELQLFCQLDREGQKLLSKAVDSLNLSARGYSRALKVARTIADLDSSQKIEVAHIAEAIQYRIEKLRF